MGKEVRQAMVNMATICLGELGKTGEGYWMMPVMVAMGVIQSVAQGFSKYEQVITKTPESQVRLVRKLLPQAHQGIRVDVKEISGEDMLPVRVLEVIW